MLVHQFAPYSGGQLISYEPLVGRLDHPGVPLSGSWTPFEVELVSREGRTEYESVDAPHMIGNQFLVLKERALPLIAEHLVDCAEVLPLICREEPLVLVNVTAVVDAVDEEASDVKRFESGRIMRVDRYVFRSEALPQSGPFRVPQSPGRMFCTKSTAVVLRERVSGLHLRPVWEG